MVGNPAREPDYISGKSIIRFKFGRWRFEVLIMEKDSKIRFVMVGGIGVLLSWAVYNIVYLNPLTQLRATSSWLLQQF